MLLKGDSVFTLVSLYQSRRAKQFETPSLVCVCVLARFYGVETILVLAFVCIPAAGKDATMVLPKWLGPPLKWLNLLRPGGVDFADLLVR